VTDFESARFRGHAYLEQLLNAPDPGDVKMKVGDKHTDDVRIVQQALFDLGWLLKVDPDLPQESFVIGTFGPVTERVVLAYKTRFGIVPAGATPSTPYTGTVGPRTMAMLDYHCTMFDASWSRIYEKYQIFYNDGLPIALSMARPNPLTVEGTHAVSWELTWDGSPGVFCDDDAVGTCEVHGPIYDAWLADYGGITGQLGLPTSDVIDQGDGTELSDFVNGRLVHDVATGIVTRPF